MPTGLLDSGVPLAHALVALPLSIAHAAAWVALTIVIRPYDAMSPVRFLPCFLASLPYHLQTDLFLYGMIIAAAHSLAYYARYRERERDAGRLAAELARARLYALELQLRPHFLFNTLHTIGGLVRTQRNQEAVSTIARLSALLRACLAPEPAQQVPLDQELALLDQYLDIERVRFCDRLRVEIDVSDEARAALVPRFILQPLAENAVRHGIAHVAGAARLSLSAQVDEGRLRIELFNTGPGLGTGAPRIGLGNTQTRLRQLYGAAASLELRDVPDGVIAALSLPLSLAAEAPR